MTDSVDEPVRLGYRFAAIPEWILFHPELSGNDIRVYGVLARSGRVKYPSVQTLAKRANVSEDTVRRSRRALEAVGAIYVEERHTDEGRQTSNLYHLAGDLPIFAPQNHEAAPAEPPPTSPAEPAPSSPAEPRGDREKQDTDQQDRDQVHMPTANAVGVSVANVAQRLIDIPTDAEASFDVWWGMYPRRVGKADALKSWHRLTPSERNCCIVLIDRHTSMWIMEGRGTSKIPYPATWLNGRCWEDEVNYVPDRPAVTAEHTPGGAIDRAKQMRERNRAK